MKSPVIEELSYCCSKQPKWKQNHRDSPTSRGAAETALSCHLLHYFLELNTRISKSSVSVLPYSYRGLTPQLSELLILINLEGTLDPDARG